MSKNLRQIHNYLYQGINYRLRTFQRGRWAHHCRPVSISFMLTDLCSARCLHCDIWKNKAKGVGATFEQWRIVLKDLRSWLGPVSICLSGGEALLVPFAIDLVAQAARLGLLVELLTHGYWQDQSKIERLALANPSRVTVSLDGIGETHTKIRGREKFFERTSASIATLQRVRKEQSLRFTIRLKCVLMSHNLDDAGKVAEYADQPGMEVFFQPIEQNYNTPEDPYWFEKSDNWPMDTEKAVATVQRLISLKGRGLPIANSVAQLQAMIPYFRDPASMRVITTMHSAHERKASCAALITIQFMPNGDVLTCYGMPPVGNIKEQSIRHIWEGRPRWWQGGCCLERRCSEHEKQTLNFAERS
jgi:MoaA/NifB/PqqE/SkfB family radical SAM enzyme